MERVPKDVLIVIDEAYREYADPAAVPDALALFGGRPNVVVLRTFSKAYALAGLRVGYCVGAPGEGVRVTIGLEQENDAFLALAKTWVA